MPSYFLNHLKRALELLISIQTSPLPDILGPLVRYDHPWKKTRIRNLSLVKNIKFHIFADRNLKLLKYVFLIR